MIVLVGYGLEFGLCVTEGLIGVGDMFGMIWRALWEWGLAVVVYCMGAGEGMLEVTVEGGEFMVFFAWRGVCCIGRLRGYGLVDYLLAVCADGVVGLVCVLFCVFEDGFDACAHVSV